MRNLRNTHYDQWKSPGGRSVTSATWDTEDSILCTFGPTKDSPLIELVKVNFKTSPPTHETVASWDAPCPNPDLLCDEVLSLHYFEYTGAACLVLAGGDIVVVKIDVSPGEDRIEIVGSIDEGITGAKWSPDEELLAITTQVNTLVFMSQNFEGVTDTTMTAEDLKASNHVSVGWGKKETQFQGKGAKALRDPTMPEKIDEGVLSPSDDSKTSISWRGDGAYLAVSKIEDGKRRLIRVYSREGVLDSVSEPVDGLEGALSWRPAGNLIAGVQRFEDRVDIVFFERNGLRHGQFSLRLSDEQLLSKKSISLYWNNDSTVLAVVMVERTQLWTMGNYHWYLKQEIVTASLLPSMPLLWHSEKPLRFMAISADSINLTEYIFVTTRALTGPPQDHGAVAVIDGKSVKLTPLRTANIPPPMSLHELEVSANIVDVSFNADASLIAVLHQEGIAVFTWIDFAASSEVPMLKAHLKLLETNSPEITHTQISFFNLNEILILQKRETGALFRRFNFGDRTGEGEMMEIDMDSDFVPKIMALSSFCEGSVAHAFVQGGGGELISLGVGEFPLHQVSFSSYLPWVEIWEQGPIRIPFGMSSNGHLYAQSRLLVKNCTSFLVTPAHLIFTTTTHLLKFVHITDSIDDLEVPADDPEIDERCRSIERGARLVTAMPTSLSLVLQMPRGNLETIYPRAMVVAGIRKLIEEKNYKKAFTHCRTQRVDMNILYDHAPQQFLSNVELFINQVKKITYLDLFLSSLREEDVTQTMYKETRSAPKLTNGDQVINGTNGAVLSELSISKTSKVNLICDAFLAVLQIKTATNLQNIITANVCKSPPALNDGLLVVAQLMKSDTEMADKAVEHICFLADVNKLYDNALGLYDLDLALLVAQQSQKDPREYLPFMQNLQQMPELRRRFSIDDHLSRHTKALTHLHSLNAFPELQSYTQKHNLYQSALSLYRYNPTEHAALTLLYAQYLEKNSLFREAALAYESLYAYTKATSCYLSSGPSSWRECLFAALSQTPPLSGPPLTDLATSLYDALMESKDYFSAASIQLDYLNSIPAAVRAYCKGYLFADAFHLIAFKIQPQLLEEVIDPALGEGFASSTELLADCKSQLLAQVPRIRELRQKAKDDPLAFYEGERGGADDLPDDVSVAASSRLSTNKSLFTRYTGKGSQGQSLGTAGTGVSRATSKNRRREERKRARGKKGSVYEEEYLVASVGRLIERIESVRGEVGRLVEGLIRRGMWERARAIETSLGDVVEMCKGCVPEVFGTEDEAKAGVEGEEWKATGGDAVLQESMEAAGKKKEAPVIKSFERLSLLGT